MITEPPSSMQFTGNQPCNVSSVFVPQFKERYNMFKSLCLTLEKQMEERLALLDIFESQSDLKESIFFQTKLQYIKWIHFYVLKGLDLCLGLGHLSWKINNVEGGHFITSGRATL